MCVPFRGARLRRSARGIGATGATVADGEVRRASHGTDSASDYGDAPAPGAGPRGSSDQVPAVSVPGHPLLLISGTICSRSSCSSWAPGCSSGSPIGSVARRRRWIDLQLRRQIEAGSAGLRGAQAVPGHQRGRRVVGRRPRLLRRRHPRPSTGWAPADHPGGAGHGGRHRARVRRPADGGRPAGRLLPASPSTSSPSAT